MSEQLQGRIIHVGDDQITIYAMNHPTSLYTAAYQNRDTKALDTMFGLTGEPVPRESEIARDLVRATGSCSLGKTEVEEVLRYFAGVARRAGNFVGLLEDELRKHSREGRLSHISEGWVDITLEYNDSMNDGATYFKRITVEERNVLFPANLQKMFF